MSSAAAAAAAVAAAAAAAAAGGCSLAAGPAHRSFLIGVTGGTGSGKTYVCREIQQELVAKGIAAERVLILSQETFYKDVPAGVAKDAHNFDHPDAFDEDKMVAALAALKRGEVRRPRRAFVWLGFVKHRPADRPPPRPPLARRPARL
jgi:uridine kinase